MFIRVDNHGLHDNSRYKRSNVMFGAKKISKNFLSKLNTLFSVKSVDIYLHASPDYDTANAALYMYNKYEDKGISAYLCTNAKELLDLGLDLKKYKIKNNNSPPSEAALLLDHNGWDKVPKKYKKLLKNTKKVWEIDHHPKTEYTIKGEFSYIDTKAKSCCAILYRIAESMNEKLTQKNLKKLYCGIISDYEKSKRIKFEKTSEGSKIKKLVALDKDKNSAEILNIFEKSLNEKERIAIHNDLDIISNLTSQEQEFRQELFSNIKIISNGKMAYVIIDPKDKKWNTLTNEIKKSTILRDLRLRLINNIPEDEMFSSSQKESFKNGTDKINIKGAIILYPIKNSDGLKAYQISMHSKSGTGYTKKWREYAKKAYEEKERKRADVVKYQFWGGGHNDRSGGRIFTYGELPVANFIASFLEAGEKVK